MNFNLFQPFFLSLFLGALLGFERSYTQKGNGKSEDLIGGIRTYSLISLAGCISSFIDSSVRPGFLIAGFSAIAGLVLIVYGMTFYRNNEKGLTTEISIILCFTLGILVEKGHYALAASITVIIMLMLYLKSYMENITGRIEQEDILAVIKFAIITFVVLPVFDPGFSILFSDLAGEKIALYESYPALADMPLVSPRNVWLMVVLISGIGFTGYIAIKLLGSKKGIGLTGFLGGLVSSTATTITFAKRSASERELSLSFSLAVLLACSTMFPRVLVEVAVVNPPLLKHLVITMGTMAFAGFSACFVIWKITGREKTDDVPLSNPFNIMPAVKFGLLYAAIVLMTRFISVVAGDSGVYIVSVLSGMTDVDAITLTMSNLSKQDPSKLNQAAVAVTLAAFSNTMMKGIMAFAIGSGNFRKGIAAGFAVIITAGCAALFFI
jgi:uncharacterized membrane protein (DUF4010 family)